METASQTGRSKYANATSFSAESPRAGPGRGGKKNRPATGLLAEDMRKAYECAETPEDSLGVKAARALVKADYGKFMTIYTKLVGNSQVAAAASVGPNEEKVGELIEKLLAEWDARDK